MHGCIPLIAIVLGWLLGHVVAVVHGGSAWCAVVVGWLLGACGCDFTWWVGVPCGREWAAGRAWLSFVLVGRRGLRLWLVRCPDAWLSLYIVGCRGLRLGLLGCWGM